MDTNTQTELFFQISSIGFVLLWILTAVLLLYLIRAVRTFNSIIEKAEEDIDEIGDITKEALEEVKDSWIFNFIFQKKKRKTKK